MNRSVRAHLPAARTEHPPPQTPGRALPTRRAGGPPPTKETAHMNEIKWQEPPAPTRRSWVGIRAALMERPGEWALVGESISRQQAYAVKRPGFEVRTDSAPHANGLIDLYMRYVGEVSA